MQESLEKVLLISSKPGAVYPDPRTPGSTGPEASSLGQSIAPGANDTENVTDSERKSNLEREYRREYAH